MKAGKCTRFPSKKCTKVTKKADGSFYVFCEYHRAMNKRSAATYQAKQARPAKAVRKVKAAKKVRPAFKMTLTPKSKAPVIAATA
jgi:hypothetical protein